MGDAPITQKFFSIFKGNMGFYVKHQPPFSMDENGKVKGRWVGIAKDKHKNILGVTEEKYKEHLEGGDGIAIEPLCENNKCFFATIDIDVIGVNYTSLIQRLYKYGLKFAPFVSKSGGLHIYFFFIEAERGSDVIDMLNRVVDTFGLNRLYTSDKGKSKVEVFPKHAVLKPDSQGSCVFLPYYNAAGRSKQKLITDDGSLVGIQKAVTFMESVFTSVKEMNSALDKLPYNDAPFCIQMITLTGALGEGDGRNDFIFSAAVYLKKKQKENFLEELKAINNELAEPQPDADVEATYKSVLAKDFQYKCKSGPCAEYCDTRLCKQREYGVGRDKGNRFTGFSCWGEISRVMAEEPYYIWKVQVDEDGPFKDLRLDGEADLMNEFVVARACVRYLNRAPLIVKPNDWVAIVNGSLAGIEDRTIVIPRNTDTTEMSALRDYFVRFLSHKQIQNGQPYLVKLGQVYRSDGIYYFTTEGFKRYLGVQKFNLGRVNLREELLRFGCEAGDLEYKLPGGSKTLACWKKSSDDEIAEMDTFYDDVMEADKLVLSDNKLNKVEEEVAQTTGGTDYGDVNF